MSLRLRLTLLYSGILALTLIAFSLVLYVTVSQVTLNAVEETLADEAQRLIGSRQFQIDHIDYQARKVAAPETYIQTLKPDGAIADRTANLGDYVLPISTSGLSACKGGQSWTETTSTEDGRLIVYSKPVITQAYYHVVKAFPNERMSLSRKRQAFGVNRPV